MAVTSMKTDYCARLTKKDIGREVTLCGWVSTVRDLGGIIFVEMRDKTGRFQVVADPQINSQVYNVFQELKDEFVIQISGKVSERPQDTYNPDHETGEIEVYPTSIKILSKSKLLPFQLENTDTSEDVRLKYRYLDLRVGKVHENIILRHKVCQAIRNYLNNIDFTEIETPIMINTTPEGARDYVVPSRVHPGRFYALPQSPQIFKQLLMVGGFEKYYQIARCFRDEDLRADRQPEFTQVDIEMSFVEQQDIINMMEGLLVEAFKVGGIDIKPPFIQMTYAEAMERYGSDRPDTRFDMELSNIQDIIEQSTFEAIKDVLKNGGIARSLKVEGIAGYSRKEMDDIRNMSISFGAKGLAWITYLEDGTVKSPLQKFLTEEQIQQVKERTGAKNGDIVFIVADRPKTTYDVLGRLRLHFGNKLNLIDPDKHNFLWVVEFPMFEYSDEYQRYVSVHHPFTMPNPEDLDKMQTEPEKCRSIAYDIVYNGNELGGGSVRIHSSEIQEKVFAALGLSEEDIQNKFGFLINAFQYGTPPHAGIALGLDRLIALLTRSESIRDVIAFPKNSAAKCLMTNAPAVISEEQYRELHLRSTYNPIKK